MPDETSMSGERVPKKDVPVQVGTHFLQQRYLYAFATQSEVTHYIRTQAVPDESARLNEFLERWGELQPRVQQLIQTELGIADAIEISALPDGHEAQVEQYMADKLFKRTFSAFPICIALVEINKLVAAQRTANLEYVDRLKASFPETLDTSALLEICVAPTRPMDPIQHLELGPNAHAFSSPNADIRFLGSFVKDLTNEDLEAAVQGGIPAAAVISFVGYGGASVNVIRAGNRVVLNNGFHRVFALRDRGVTHIPVVIQFSNNPALDFPPQVAGLPKEYLLGMPRPVIMKDFFEPDFAITLRVRKRIKLVTLSTSVGQHDVPA